MHPRTWGGEQVGGEGVQPYHLPVDCMKALCSWKVSRGSRSLWRKSLTTPQSTFMSQFQGCLLHKDAPSLPWSSSQSCVWGMVIRESVIKTVDRNMRIDSDLAMLCKSMVPGNSTTFCRLWCCVHTLALCTCQSGWIPFSISASDTVDDECRQTANSGGREGC